MAAGAAVITVGAGLALRAVAEGNGAKYGGDALYTVLLVALVVLGAPRVTPLTAAAGALAVTAAGPPPARAPVRWLHFMERH